MTLPLSCSPSFSPFFLLELTQITNAYVLQGGSLYTSDEHVLKGSARHQILQVCNDLGVPVVLHGANVKDIDEWEEVFLSSMMHILCLAVDLSFP